LSGSALARAEMYQMNPGSQVKDFGGRSGFRPNSIKKHAIVAQSSKNHRDES